MQMQENTFGIGWQENIACRIYDTGRHVSDINLNVNVPPANLKPALAVSNPDQKLWGLSYDEEYGGLNSLDVFTVITYINYYLLY